MSIGENIKRIRKSRKLSQDALSKLSGVSRVNISRYENNERIPNLDIAEKLSKALEVPLFLLTRNEEINIPILGKIRPNYDLIEEEYIPKDLAAYYKKLFERERQQRMEHIGDLILTLREERLNLTHKTNEIDKKISEINETINGYEEFLTFCLEGTDITLESFLEEIENETKELKKFNK